MQKALILLFLFLGSFGAMAVPLPPRSMMSGNSGFLTRSLGPSCFAFELSADSLPCNPAYMARNKDKLFKTNIFFGNNIRYTQEISDLLRDQADAATVRNLFSKQDDSELETSIEAGFLGQKFGAAISPFDLSYRSMIRNPALPQVTLFASQEESVRVQFAGDAREDLYWGLQLRYAHRKFLSKRFFLTDALAEDGEKLFDPKDQNAFYVEPSLLYAPSDWSWNPQVGLGLMNLGATNPTVSEFPSNPQYHLAASVSNTIGWGKLGFGFDAFWDQNVETLSEPLTAGTFYEFGILRLLASLSEKTTGAGFQVTSGVFNLGLTYSTEDVDDGWGDKTTYRRIYMLLGIEI